MITDDQDSELGGWEPMRQVQARIAGRGATATHWRIHTPICAPSRSQLQSKSLPVTTHWSQHTGHSYSEWSAVCTD